MKKHLLLFLLPLLLALCGYTLPRAGQKSAWEVLFPGRGHAKMLNWRLVASFDPYNGGQLTRFPTTPKTELQLWQNGKAKEIAPNRTATGKWFMNPAQDRLMIEFPPSEHLPSPQKDAHYPYRFEMRHDTLVLSRQGRHGWVEQRYVEVKR